jgi:hypothetical protein
VEPLRVPVRPLVRQADQAKEEHSPFGPKSAIARPLVRQADQSATEGAPRTRRGPLARQLARHTDQATVEKPENESAGRPGRPLVRQADQPGGEPGRGRVLVVGCGALGRELVALTSGLPNVDVACLPPGLHNQPGGIPARVRARIRQGRRDGYERMFVAYADCGTGGLLDPVLVEEGVERLPGAHCYEFFAGRTDFARLADEEPATFWLTDFLARNFERLVIRGLGIDRHPELEPMYFGNYRRVVYLSQTDDAELLALARAAADRLGLAFEHRHTGYGELATSLAAALGEHAPHKRVDSRPASTSNNVDAVGPEIGPSTRTQTAGFARNSRRASNSDNGSGVRVARARGTRMAAREASR